MSSYAQEVKDGQRFEFGKNWSSFLSLLTEERIVSAEQSLKHMLRLDSLEGKSLLDIGSGSGLFSLAARRLGATVHSFDFDPNSVACARELKRRYFSNDEHWTIEEGSVLDPAYVAQLGRYDIVYSWGVLHHTGQMWQALENAGIPVAQGGKLFIAIYNDQGLKSRLWTRVKKTYSSSRPGKVLMTILGASVIILGGLKSDLLRLRNPLSRYKLYKQQRGMSAWHDIVDWLGGYPFEVATPEEVFAFYYDRGFDLAMLKTDGGGSGTNEFVFVKR